MSDHTQQLQGITRPYQVTGIVRDVDILGPVWRVTLTPMRPDDLTGMANRVESYGRSDGDDPPVVMHEEILLRMDGLIDDVEVTP